jgi:hypothetical protein
VSSLAQTQRAFVALCLDQAPGNLAELAAEDEAARLLLYRDMVRWRFHQIAGEVLPRSKSLAGLAFAPLVDRWISEARPRSRFFRDLPLAFADFALAQGALEPLVRDVLVLERARWHAAIAPDGEAPRPFELTAVPVPAPSLTTFVVDHAVQVSGGDEPKRVHLAVYRRPDLEIETRWSSPTLHALLSGWAVGDRPAIDVVRSVLAAEGREPTPTFVEEMSGFLAELIERGAILGSR